MPDKWYMIIVHAIIILVSTALLIITLCAAKGPELIVAAIFVIIDVFAIIGVINQIKNQ